MLRTLDGKMLYGDWRRRRGTKTDAHLYAGKEMTRRPICGKRIIHLSTVAVAKGRPCIDCLVNAIGGRDYSHA